MDGKTGVCGILADPVEHSMSPLLQNLFAERTGINLAYVPFRVAPKNLEAAVRGAYSLNIRGLNVTVPHKQAVMAYLKETEETAKRIGAVNTLVRVDGGFRGCNTDAPGLLRAIREAGFTVSGRPCVLVGAGGAAKAAAYLMIQEGAQSVCILNRSRERAEKLAAWGNELAGRRLFEAFGLEEAGRLPEDGYFAVQCTSVGMHPAGDRVPIADPAFYAKIREAVDCIYTPSDTRFMQMVRATGGRAINGLNMLLYQGVLSFELWNPGVRVSEAVIREARGLISLKLALAGREKESGETASGKNRILIGFMGAGKTTVGRELARRTGMEFCDTDQLIEEAAGMPISDFFALRGEEAFREEETKLLKRLVREQEEHPDQPGRVIAVGGGLPVRRENRELLKRLGFVIYLEISPETVLKRLEGDTTRPLLQGDDPRGTVTALMALRDGCYRDAAHLVLNADQETAGDLAARIGRLPEGRPGA